MGIYWTLHWSKAEVLFKLLSRYCSTHTYTPNCQVCLLLVIDYNVSSTMLWLLCYLFFRGQPSNAFCSHLMKNWTPSTLLSPYAAANPQHSRGLSFAVKWRWLRHITQEQCLSPYAGTVLVISVNLLRPVSQYIIIMSPGSVMAIGWLSGEMERSCCEDSRVEISFFILPTCNLSLCILPLLFGGNTCSSICMDSETDF